MTGISSIVAVGTEGRADVKEESKLEAGDAVFLWRLEQDWVQGKLGKSYNAHASDLGVRRRRLVRIADICD